MDKAKANKEKRIDNGNTSRPPLTLMVKVAPEKIEELHKITSDVDRYYQTLLTEVDKKLRAFFSDKFHYELNREILQLENNVARNDYTKFYAIAYLESRLSTLETIVKGIAEKVSLDIPNLKSQIEALHKTIEQPAIAETLEFIQFVRKRQEEAKERQKEYVK